MNQKCDRCLFGKNKIVSDARRVHILQQTRRTDTHFVCHKSTMSKGSEEIVCRGFYEASTSQMIRIAQRLNAIEFVSDPTKPADS
jgi:hypothetical protein